MNRQRLRHLGLVSLAFLTVAQSYAEIANRVHASAHNELAWVTVVPEDEEFTVTAPISPTVRTYPVSSTDYPGHETILAHQEYGGYGDGMIFIIESYKAARPQRLWADLPNSADKSAVFESEISFDGISAKQYRSAYSNSYATYTRHIVRFGTKQHVYLMTLVTLEDTNPSVDRFLSSLRLRRPEDQTRVYSRSYEFILGYAFNPSQLTRRAIIVWKAEPFYTPQARAHQTAGTVTLEAILAEDGYVANITVTKELKDGLTEAAIDAARCIRFFPAEKDGRLVSQRIMLEYNFNVY
jgi:TonB family protein